LGGNITYVSLALIVSVKIDHLRFERRELLHDILWEVMVPEEFVQVIDAQGTVIGSTRLSIGTVIFMILAKPRALGHLCFQAKKPLS
jgi:hypothetical protein